MLANQSSSRFIKPPSFNTWGESHSRRSNWQEVMNKDCKNISFLLVIYVDQNLLCPWSLISQVQQLNSKWILLKPLTVQPKVRSGRRLVTVHNPAAVSSGDLQHSRWILFDGGPSLRQVGRASVAEQQPECQIKVPKPTWHPQTSRTDVPPWLWSDSCRRKWYTTQSNQRWKINQRSTAPSPLDPVFIGPGAVDPFHISCRSTCQPWPLKHAKMGHWWHISQQRLLSGHWGGHVPTGTRHTADTRWWPQMPPATSRAVMVCSQLQQEDSRSKVRHDKTPANLCCCTL